eukprot:gene21702-28726_t
MGPLLTTATPAPADSDGSPAPEQAQAVYFIRVPRFRATPLLTLVFIPRTTLVVENTRWNDIALVAVPQIACVSLYKMHGFPQHMDRDKAVDEALLLMMCQMAGFMLLAGLLVFFYRRKISDIEKRGLQEKEKAGEQEKVHYSDSALREMFKSDPGIIASHEDLAMYAKDDRIDKIHASVTDEFLQASRMIVESSHFDLLAYLDGSAKGFFGAGPSGSVARPSAGSLNMLRRPIPDL